VRVIDAGFYKLLNVLVLCFGLTFLSSCKWATVNPQAFKGPDGRPAFVMRCSGLGKTIALCYQKASEVCPSGYDVIERSSGTIGIPQSGGGTLIAPKEGMAIQCR